MQDLEAPPSWCKALLRGKMSTVGRTASGVTVWSIEDQISTATVSDQFRLNAADYHQRYAASDHFEGLFCQALQATGLSVSAAPTILDLGSGSGVNSVIPCLRLFPGAKVVATDLSGELLGLLAEALFIMDAQDQVAPVVMDAMGDHAARNAFDLVTGAAILHHLLSPDQGLRAAFRALKPGGTAIFFEPFDGYAMIGLAYRRILSEGRMRPRPLDSRLEGALAAISADITARTQPDRNDPAFAMMDDKWLFSQERIVKISREIGFASVDFVPQNDHVSLYRDTAQVQMRLATGLDDLQLPDWAVDILDEFDAALPMATKRRVMLESAIVLTKG